MLSEEAKEAIKNSARQMIAMFGAARVAIAAKNFADCQPTLLRQEGYPDLAVEIEQNREEVNQIIAGCLGMM